MKKWVVAALCASLAAAGGWALAKNTDTITLIVNGNKVETDVAPQIINGRVMVPVRAVSEAMGAEVAWDSEQKSVIVRRPEGPKPIARLPLDQTTLYALKEKDGQYAPLLVEHKGQFKLANWKNVTNPTYAPKIESRDLTGDGKHELIIILTTGYGTGALTQDIHVLQTDTFEERRVPDPVETVKQNVTSKVAKEQVEMSIGGKTTVIPANKIPAAPSTWFPSVGIGGIVTYETQENALLARVPAQISPAHFLGHFHITYQFVQDQFQVTSIEFVQD
ncbi:copper amine oxidase N-terminal domain-containing protein [Brevibacillus thermoruber]|uniref:copper amine oxidase N-terminal domain-containing protein n=1 Tax=Brevibacillus thermoruber TaxID=33942 RepID=UPI000404DC3F|nr:copper amine oxidase N-terminal domain-containing protein [Brevibacillus thermoruber]